MRLIWVLVALLITGCAARPSVPLGTPTPGIGGSSDRVPEVAGVVSTPSTMVNDHGSEDVRAEHEIVIETDSYYFEPTVLAGSPGQRLQIEIENPSSLGHNF